MSLLSPKALAEAWEVPLSWIYARVRARDLPHMKVGMYLRFDEDEMRAWLAEHRRETTQRAQRKLGGAVKESQA
jgi:predicted DNA-binding transcriptional regulator AlpA